MASLTNSRFNASFQALSKAMLIMALLQKIEMADAYAYIDGNGCEVPSGIAVSCTPDDAYFCTCTDYGRYIVIAVVVVVLLALVTCIRVYQVKARARAMQQRQGGLPTTIPPTAQRYPQPVPVATPPVYQNK